MFIKEKGLILDAEDPEEFGHFSHETYMNEVDGRYYKTKGKIK